MKARANRLAAVAAGVDLLAAVHQEGSHREGSRREAGRRGADHQDPAVPLPRPPVGQEGKANQSRLAAVRSALARVSHARRLTTSAGQTRY